MSVYLLTAFETLISLNKHEILYLDINSIGVFEFLCFRRRKTERERKRKRKKLNTNVVEFMIENIHV